MIQTAKAEDLIAELLKIPHIKRFSEKSEIESIVLMSIYSNKMLMEKGEEAIETIMTTWVTLGMNNAVTRKNISKSAKSKDAKFLIYYEMFKEANQLFVYRTAKTIRNVYEKKLLAVTEKESLIRSAELTIIYIALLFMGRMFFLSKMQ